MSLTDEQMNDYIYRLNAVISRLGARVGLLQEEINTLVNTERRSAQRASNEAQAREISEAFIRQLTLRPQGRWDADVVEYETSSMETSEVIHWLAQRLAAALAAKDRESERERGAICAQRDAAVEALRRFGAHHTGCPAWPIDGRWREHDSQLCGCGLGAALAAGQVEIARE